MYAQTKQYYPKDWPEYDLVLSCPPTKVQTQASDLVEQSVAELAEVYSDNLSKTIDELEYQKTNAPLKDGKLPPYYRTAPDGTIIPITKSEYKKGMLKEFTVKHKPLPCGHKLVADQNGPRHRNCDACWFTYFQVFGEMTQAVDEAYNSKGTDVGREIIKQLRGVKFLRNFLRFMSTVAAMKVKMESNVQEATV